MVILYTILFLLVLMLVAFIFTHTLIVIQQNSVGLVTTLGKYNHRPLEPGLHFLIPGIQRVERVNLAQIPQQLDQQTVITKDNAEVTASLSMNFHVTNPESYVFQNQDSVASVIYQTRAQLRGIIGEKELNDVLNQTEEINAKLQAQLDSVTDPYGVKVDRINIDSIKPSQSIQDSMDQQVRADREKTAAILKSEGEAQATQKTADANAYRVQKQADANYYQVKKQADAEAYRIQQINEALATAPDNYFINQQIEALNTLASGKSNTIVLPNSAIDSLGNLPVAGKLFTANSDNKSSVNNKTK